MAWRSLLAGCLSALGVVGCSSATSARVSIDATVEIVSLEISLSQDGVAKGSRQFSSPRLPSSMVVLLSDVPSHIDIALSAIDDTGQTLFTTASVESVPGRQVQVNLLLASPAQDLGSDDAGVDDMGGVDASGGDLGGLDLGSAPDLVARPDMAHSVAERQVGSVGATANGALSLTLPANSAAGTLLVATLATADEGAVSAPAGWKLAVDSIFGTTAHAHVLYYPNNPGGIGAVTFTIAGNTIKGQLSEWSGAAANPLDVTRSATATGVTSIALSTGPLSSSGEVSLASHCERLATASSATFTPSSGWSSLGDTGTNANVVHYAADDKVGLSTAATETETSTQSGDWAAAIATFHP